MVKEILPAFSSKYIPNLKEYREAGIANLEKEYLEKLLSVSKGNIKEAGKISGLSRSRLYGLLKKHNIERP